ncbi:MAG TPA: shikimate dehydrogenase [Bacillota bacterium]|nr:shikimate dehydrogenase [Bacillota bacterium]
MNNINAKTKICAVYGDPIGHTLSPAMHNAAFKALQMDYIYIACHVLPEQLPAAVQGIRALGITGVNVTIPHKQAVLGELDEIFGESLRSGSVNTIINRQGKLLGTSTDGVGLVRSLQYDGNFDPRGKKVLLFGAGGSALAVIYSLIAAGIGSLTLVNRSLHKAIYLQEKVRRDSGFGLTVHTLDQLDQVDFKAFDLVINTTSVGLQEDVSIVPSVYLHPGLLVYDLVYRSGGTKLLNEAAAAGCRVLSGLSMLLFQGVESFRLWFEVEPPIEVMRQALVAASQG